jgi:hypothetical protein
MQRDADTRSTDQCTFYTVQNHSYSDSCCDIMLTVCTRKHCLYATLSESEGLNVTQTAASKEQCEDLLLSCVVHALYVQNHVYKWVY